MVGYPLKMFYMKKIIPLIVCLFQVTSSLTAQELYGFTCDCLIKYDAANNHASLIYPFRNYLLDGRYIADNLLQASNGKLYGMTVNGGVRDHGVIFSVNLSTSTYTKLKDFDCA